MPTEQSGDAVSRDPAEPPTAGAFRLTTDAHSNLCVVPNELGDDEDLQQLADDAREACMELFNAMAEKRDLDDDEFEDVYLDIGSETWEYQEGDA